MTLTEFIKTTFTDAPHHFTNRSIEAKADTLTVIKGSFGHQCMAGHHWIDCTGPRGGRITVLIEYAKYRRSYRIH